VIELEKKMGSSFFFLARQFAANCEKSRMYYCQTAKDEKKSVDLGFSKVGLLSFSLTSLNKAKSALCLTAYPPPTAAALGCGLSTLYRLFHCCRILPSFCVEEL
jgi:hypothetical protein